MLSSKGKQLVTHPRGSAQRPGPDSAMDTAPWGGRAGGKVVMDEGHIFVPSPRIPRHCPAQGQFSGPDSAVGAGASAQALPPAWFQSAWGAGGRVLWGVKAAVCESGYLAFLPLLPQPPSSAPQLPVSTPPPPLTQAPWGDNYLSQVLPTGGSASSSGFRLQVSGTWRRAAQGQGAM